MPQPTFVRLTHSRLQIPSLHLERRVTVDVYLPAGLRETVPVLLINDGQDLVKMPLAGMLDQLLGAELIRPLCCVGIHAGSDRRREYGTAHATDYLGRGNRAAAYSRFVLEELMPVLRKTLPVAPAAHWAFAGFSLGGLSALDIGWHHPELFRAIGIFSGSLWWRSLDMADPAYRDEHHRLMHAAIRGGHFVPGRKFFFECGTEDETADRNGNGIIDSIDDTRDLIGELVARGYREGEDIHYLEIEGGRHDVPTWALAMPAFLQWGWGSE